MQANTSALARLQRGFENIARRREEEERARTALATAQAAVIREACHDALELLVGLPAAGIPISSDPPETMLTSLLAGRWVRVRGLTQPEILVVVRVSLANNNSAAAIFDGELGVHQDRGLYKQLRQSCSSVGILGE